ncbi:hypothetical protein FACS1894172_19960 [Spirochaetia bacterium]|nr:hypothetical protein FACS1894164_19920 [Spirochaetia bacterium]GHU36832.1 hypothetical protein FACS1894172_19960 [Spirochaetia bacterium]
MKLTLKGIDSVLFHFLKSIKKAARRRPTVVLLVGQAATGSGSQDVLSEKSAEVAGKEKCGVF